MTSANVAGVMQMPNLLAKVNKLSEEIGTGVDFTEMLQQNTGGGSGTPNDALQTAGTQAPAPTQAAGTVSYEKEQVKTTASRDQVSDKTEAKADKVQAAEGNKELADDAQKLDSDVKKAVAKSTDTSEEDVEKAMEELGLTAADLLIPSNLAELVSQLTDTEDQVQLLLSDSFAELTAQITDIFKEAAQQQNMQLDEFTQVMGELLDTEAAPEEIPDLNEAGPLKEASDTFVQTDSESKSAVITRHVTTTESDGETVVTDTAEDGKETVTVVNTAKAEEKEDTSSEQDTGKKDSADKKDSHLETQAHAMIEARVEGPRTFEVPQQQEFVPQTPVNTQELFDQLVEQTRISYTAGQDTSIEMVLNPEELGKLLLKVVADKNGHTNAQITVQNEDVKEAIVQQMAILKDNLSGAGIKIDAIEVTVSSHAFEENLEQNFSGEEQAGEEAERKATARRSINLNDLDSLQGLMTEEEQLIASMMADQGNTMSVQA